MTNDYQNKESGGCNKPKDIEQGEGRDGGYKPRVPAGDDDVQPRDGEFSKPKTGGDPEDCQPRDGGST